MLNYNNYKSFNEINRIVICNLHKVPEDIDLVVGIPRSGLIISTLISEYINKPATDVFSYINLIDNKPVNPGSLAPSTDIANARKILLVDDAVGLGITFEETKKLISTKSKCEIITLAPFVEPFSTNKVDIYFEIWQDQFMPWSVFKRGIIEACCDIDGMLTEDIPLSVDDDGEKYINFLKNQRPKFRTKRIIHTLVSGRLEKYRQITEEWLRKHNIKYQNLFLLPAKSKEDKFFNYNVGKFKAEIFRQSGLPIFFESSIAEAREIKNICKDKAVYCSELGDYIT